MSAVATPGTRPAGHAAAEIPLRKADAVVARPVAPSRRSAAARSASSPSCWPSLWVFPIYWMINSAFLPLNKLQTPEPTFFPAGGTLSNFRRVLDDPTFWAAMRISLAVVVVVLVAALLFAFLAALAVSRFRFRGRKGFILTILVVQMIPAEGLFISQYQMLDGWNLVNKVAGLSLVYTAAILPFTIWMLRGFVAGVPIELEEAGMVDGLSRTAAFFRITFPLLAPGLVAAGVYGFLQAWNEYTLALVVMTDPAAAHAAAVAAGARRVQPRHRLGRRHGGLGTHRDPRHRLLPVRAEQDDVRARRGCGEGLT